MNGRMELTGRPSCLFNTLGKFPSAVYAKGKQIILLPAPTPPHPTPLCSAGLGEAAIPWHRFGLQVFPKPVLSDCTLDIRVLALPL